MILLTVESGKQNALGVRLELSRSGNWPIAGTHLPARVVEGLLAWLKT
jgi:hypothetical protein